MSRLFRECVQIIDAQVLSEHETQKISQLFEQLYPITYWGKIDWEKFTNKIVIGYDHNEIIPALEAFLKCQSPKYSYIVWSRGDIPIINTKFKNIIDYFDDVVCVGFETFIFDPYEGLIIEILSDGKITAGIVPVYNLTGIS